MLHLTKIAFGCASVDVLRARLEGRAGTGGETTVNTRFRPKRADELVGGSLFWILNHRLVVRQPIMGFAEAEGGRCLIRLAMPLIPVEPRPRRAHQGWRYLEGADAPGDLGGGGDGLAALPPQLVEELAALALI